MDEIRRFSPAIVAPTYNNAAALRAVAEGAARFALPVIVVNDGSTDATGEILQTLRSELTVVQVATHGRNLGKAAALQTGFSLAQDAGCTHVVTIDTDGQLDPEEIPRLLEASRHSPDALVIGVRDERAADYPAASRTGRRISNLLVRLESGARVADSQCGFRVYPLELVARLHCRAGRYGFETEVLTRAAWASCALIEVPVTCRYAPAGARVSHFRPWIDSLRAVAMHARLMLRALVPLPHTTGSAQPRPHGSRGLHRLLDWLNPARLWRDVRQQRLGAQETATGIAVGVFIGNMPIYGLQTLASLYAARRLHLHPLPVVAGSQVSTPPLGPVLIAIAIGVGHWLLHGTWFALPRWHATWRQWAQLIGHLFLEWSVGSVLVGVVLAAAAFVVARALLAYATVDAARD
jgi:uncharacterized protein (DUF2062 family)